MTWTHCRSSVHSDATASSRIRSKKRPVAGCASSAAGPHVARRWVDAVLMRVATGTDDEYDDGAGGGSDSGSWNTTLVDSSAGSGH